MEALQQLHDKLVEQKESYWADQVDIQRVGASAWLAFAQHRKDDALSAMRNAADREDATEKNALTPGPNAPARELLGVMLLQFHEPRLAQTEFAATLVRAGIEPRKGGDGLVLTRDYHLGRVDVADAEGRWGARRNDAEQVFGRNGKG